MQHALDAYIQEILDSREYRDYTYALEKVKQNPELKAKIDEYRARNFQLQTAKDTAFEKIQAFEKEYADFLDVPMVSEFLDAELAFCRMMQKNNETIMKAICFE